LSMERYVEQLLADIGCAAVNVDGPYGERELGMHDWVSDEEEERTKPRRLLEEWTGIRDDGDDGWRKS